jgi:hypothetical protein
MTEPGAPHVLSPVRSCGPCNDPHRSYITEVGKRSIRRRRRRVEHPGDTAGDGWRPMALIVARSNIEPQRYPGRRGRDEEDLVHTFPRTVSRTSVRTRIAMNVRRGRRRLAIATPVLNDLAHTAHTSASVTPVRPRGRARPGRNDLGDALLRNIDARSQRSLKRGAPI